MTSFDYVRHGPVARSHSDHEFAAVLAFCIAVDVRHSDHLSVLVMIAAARLPELLVAMRGLLGGERTQHNVDLCLQDRLDSRRIGLDREQLRHSAWDGAQP